MKKETAWIGRYAQITKTGEVVEVISYDDLHIQVKTSKGFCASLSRNDVHAVRGLQEAGLLIKIKALTVKLLHPEIAKSLFFGHRGGHSSQTAEAFPEKSVKKGCRSEAFYSDRSA